MSDKQKTLWMALAGAGTLIAAALIYHSMSSKDEEDDSSDPVDE